MNNKYMKCIIKYIVVVSLVLISCADPHLRQITNPSIKKSDRLLDATSQQPEAETHYVSTVICDEPPQLTLDNAATEVISYLQTFLKISLDSKIQSQEQYKITAKRLLQQIEALKKSQKLGYRMADRNFIYNSDVSGEGMYLLQQEMKYHSAQLKLLRNLRRLLVETFHFSKEELLACKVKIKPANDLTDNQAIDSSDEEKLTYSRGELALRRGGLQGFKQGILRFPSHFLESLRSMLLDHTSTVDKLVEYLIDTSDVSDEVTKYIDSIEGNEEEKGKEIGEWITSQILVGMSEIYQASLIKDISKIKLIKALLKVVKIKYQQATKLPKLTQQGAKQIGQLITYQEQSAQEVATLCQNHPLPPVIKNQGYWRKSLTELANLAAKDDEDAKNIIDFLKKAL